MYNKAMTKQVDSTTKVREKLFIKAKLEGKNNTQAAMVATGTKSKDVAKKQGNTLSTSINVQTQIQKALKNYGITIDILVGVAVSALTAVKSTSIQGEVYPTDIPDHTVRLAAMTKLAELAGMKYKPDDPNSPWKQVQPGTITPEVSDALQQSDEVELQRVILRKDG